MLDNLLQNVWVVKILKVLVVIIVNLIIYNIVLLFVKDLQFFNNKKTKTFVRLIRSIIRYIFIIITVLIILQIFGFNVSSIFAGVGIFSIIIGFAIQDALKDIIKGFDIISDSYYRVGDVIKFGEITGKVLVIGLKTTKIEDVNTLNVVSISNRNIEQVEVVSNLINIDIPFPYEVKVKDAEKIIEEITKNVMRIEKVDKCNYHGINNLSDSSIDYQIKVYCNPIYKTQTRRDCLNKIVETLEKNNINIPYMQIDIHNK